MNVVFIITIYNIDKNNKAGKYLHKNYNNKSYFQL
jgi:hypothetical protein